MVTTWLWEDNAMLRIFLLFLTVCVFAPVPSQAAEPPADPVADDSFPDAPPDVLMMDSDAYRRMMVEVNIDGRGPYSFIVDTGAERTVISREVATQLELKSGKSISLHGVGNTIKANTVIIPRLTVNQLQLRRIEAPALSQYHIGAEGILGIDALQKKNVLMDFKQKTMTLTNSNDDLDENWDGQVVVIIARKKFGQLILTNAMINDQPVDVILDTGGQISIGNEALRRKLGGDVSDLGHKIMLISVTGNRTEADRIIARRLRVAGLTFQNLPMAFADMHLFKVLGFDKKPAMMLGMDALRLFDRVSVDFRSRKVRFNLPPGTPINAAIAN
jgi:predicted aspartyl protease